MCDHLNRMKICFVRHPPYNTTKKAVSQTGLPHTELSQKRRTSSRSRSGKHFLYVVHDLISYSSFISFLQQVAKIVETLHLLGPLLISLLSLTLQPPSPLISVASKTNKCWKLKQSTLNRGEGRGSGKGLNSRYGRHWKLEKVFFNESLSTIFQLVV